MTYTFKPGDIVECINEDGASGFLTVGKTYTISHAHESGNCVYLAGMAFYFISSRFKLYQSTVSLPQPVKKPKINEIIGEITCHMRPVGLVKRSINDKIMVVLSPLYLYPPDHPDAGMQGMKDMGEFESFKGFQLTGSYSDLSVRWI